jgi:hypothetical protein
VKVGLRSLITGLAVLGAAAVALVVLWPRAPSPPESHPAAPSPAYPRLLVEPGWTQGGMFADVHGGLSVNDRGCVTVGGDVIVTRDGSRVTPDGKHVVFAGWAPIKLGTSVGGGGGWYPQEWVENQARKNWGDAWVAAAEACLRDDRDSGLLQFWLAE